MSKLTLTEVVQKSPAKGGWCYVPLSKEILAELRRQSGKNGNVPVVATVGETTWTSTIMSRGNQQWYLALKTDVRNAESINEGDTITVKLKPNQAKLIKEKK